MHRARLQPARGPVRPGPRRRLAPRRPHLRMRASPTNANDNDTHCPPGNSAGRTNGTSASRSGNWPSCATAGGHRAAQPAVTSATPAASGTARKSGHAPYPAVPPRRRSAGRAGDRGPGNPLHDGGRGLRRGRLRGGRLLLHIYGLGRSTGRTARRGGCSRSAWTSLSWPPRSCCCTRPATTATRQGWPG